MSLQWWALVMMIIATLLGAFGSLLLKRGVMKFSLHMNLNLLIRNKGLFLGLFMYGVAAIFGILSYKGGDLSILFPISSLSYVWGTLFAVLLLDEKMNLYKYIAIVLIIVGIIVLVQ